MLASGLLAPNNIVLTILGEPEANWLTFGEIQRRSKLINLHHSTVRFFKVCQNPYFPYSGLIFIIQKPKITFSDVLKSSRRARDNYITSGGFQRRSKLICACNITVQFCDIWKNPYFSYKLANLDDPKAQNYVF